MTEKEFREAIANLMLTEYLPKLKDEVNRFMNDTRSKCDMADWLTYVVKIPVVIDLGELQVADSSNEFIDKIVKLYVKTK